MSAIHVLIRVGRKSKAFTVDGKRAVLGKGADCDLVLPFDWLSEAHLVVEDTEQAMRARIARPQAKATVGGRPLTLEWSLLPSPARIEVPTPKGYPLVIEFSSAEPSYQTMILRSAQGAGQGGDESALGKVQSNRFNSQVWSESSEEGGESVAKAAMAAEDGVFYVSATAAEEAEPWSNGQKIYAVIGLYLILIAAALAFNRYRHVVQLRHEQDEVAFIQTHIESAKEFLRQKDYIAAKTALDRCDAVVRKYPDQTEATVEIAQLRALPEIKLGGIGYVQVEQMWLPAEQAKQYQAERTRDDPKIADLERKAADAQNSKKYSDAKAACEEALSLMESEVVKPHPRQEPVKAELAAIERAAVVDDMKAKGYVLYQDRWVTEDEKRRLENTAKGLVEYEGLWMTKEEAQAAQARGGTGRVFYNNKWMTQDEKMQAQGMVKFEGTWMKPEARDDLLAKRAEEAKNKGESEIKDKETAAAAAIEAEKNTKLKSVAYTKSQEFLQNVLPEHASLKFVPFEDPAVKVIFDADEGWYIVRAVVDQKEGNDGSVRKTYYCKLRPVSGDKWEAQTTILAD